MKSRPPTIAIVHDDGELARLLAHSLRERGVRALTALSIRDAMAIFHLSRPDLLLVGIAECEAAPDELGQLRSSSAGKPQVPILVLVRPGSEDRRRALRMGLTQHLPVPSEDDELFLTVGSFLPLGNKPTAAPAQPTRPSTALDTRPLAPAAGSGSSPQEDGLDDLFGPAIEIDPLTDTLGVFDRLADETTSFLAEGELAELLEQVRADLFETLPMISLFEIGSDGGLSVPPGADRVLASLPADSLRASLGTWGRSVLEELERRHPGRLAPETLHSLASAVTTDSLAARGPRP